MHRALLLPEIVQAIVRAGKIEPGLLYSCLFVNKIFSHEACRILWKGCYGIFGVGHVSPTVRDLGRMVSNPAIGRERAQIYANYIRVLIFDPASHFGWDSSSPPPQHREDAAWHSQLCQLEYPLLEDLSIWRSRSAEKLNTESAILHYFHSGLRDLRVDASAPLTDRFLDKLSCLCPYLQQLDVDFKDATISKEGFARFSTQMLRLEGIHVASLENGWSAEAFSAIARYERLKLLHVPHLHDDWFDGLDASSSFSALKQLYTLGTKGRALLRLHSASPGLEVIHLYNTGLEGPEDVLLAVSKYHLLTSFKYLPNFNTAISGEDLVMLARGCLNLTTLIIGQIPTFPFGDNLGSTPLLVDVDDNVISSIAQSLPSLKNFELIGRYESYPSLNGIMSVLNQCCPLLEGLEISCGSDWITLTHVDPQQWSFMNLTTLTLAPSAHMDEILSDLDIQALRQCFKSFAPGWFPALQFFNIIDADDCEQDLLDFMFELADERENGGDKVDTNEEQIGRVAY